MRTPSKNLTFYTENVGASSIAARYKNITGIDAGNRPVNQAAKALNISPVTPHGSKNVRYTNAAAVQIIEYMLERKASIPVREATRSIFDNSPHNLDGYSDADLVAELRRRGWDVTATRTRTESL